MIKKSRKNDQNSEAAIVFWDIDSWAVIIDGKVAFRGFDAAKMVSCNVRVLKFEK